MSMEHLEERCLAYLSQAVNPLVPFNVLLDYVRRPEDLGQFGERELLSFLKSHELVHILEISGTGESDLLIPDTFAILKSRIPEKKTS